MLKRAELILSPDLEKHIRPSYDGQWGPSYIPVHSRFFEKIASSTHIPEKILKIIETLKARDDGRYLHVNAVGADKAWSSNRNGDSFFRWSLRHEPPPDWAMAILKEQKREVPEDYGHETFERYGYPFLLHANKDPMLSIGERVCCSAYNDPMERVELIIFISKDKAPDLVQRIDSGEHLPFSMGCRVPWDRCSYCGNISKTRESYCDHLKTLMNVILPDGRKVMAENWFPKFFDISVVTTPAWAPAYALRKVAGMNIAADPTAITRAREHAPFPIDIQKIASAQEAFKRASIKTSDIMKNVPLKAEPPIAGLNIKPELLAKIRDIVEKDIATRRSIPTATMNALGQDFSPADLVNGMTSAGILLDNNDLNSITGGNAANLPGRLDLSGVPSRLLMRLRNLVGGWSMFDQPLANRAVRVIRITVGPRPGLEKTSSAVAGKYRKLLEELPVDELIKAASRVELLMVVDPHAVEDSIVGGRTTDDRIQPVLPFVVGVRLSLDH